jgi:hypothetical protein
MDFLAGWGLGLAHEGILRYFAGLNAPSAAE